MKLLLAIWWCEVLITDYAVYNKLTVTRQTSVKSIRFRQEMCHKKQLAGPNTPKLQVNLILTKKVTSQIPELCRLKNWIYSFRFLRPEREGSLD